MGTIFRNTLKIAFYASLVPLMILVVLIVMDVGARYMFNSAVTSALEISQLLLSMLISLSLGYTTYIKDNFAVAFVVEKLPETVQNIIEMVSCCIASGVCFVLTSQAIKQAIYSTKGKEFTGALQLPVYPTKWVFALGCLLTAIVLVVQFLNAFRRGKRNSGEERDRVF
jgi:TRAP-type C4-dicarboxylate transport system permease small subunit